MPRPVPVIKVINAPSYSDGDSTHRPDPNWRYPINDIESILEDIGYKWMRDNLELAQAGKFLWTMAIATLLVIVVSSLIISNAALRTLKYSLLSCSRV